MAAINKASPSVAMLSQVVFSPRNEFETAFYDKLWSSALKIQSAGSSSSSSSNDVSNSGGSSGSGINNTSPLSSPGSISVLSGLCAKEFFLKSKIDSKVLRTIWSISVGKSGNMRLQQFYTAARFVCLVQNYPAIKSKHFEVAKNHVPKDAEAINHVEFKVKLEETMNELYKSPVFEGVSGAEESVELLPITKDTAKKVRYHSIHRSKSFMDYSSDPILNQVIKIATRQGLFALDEYLFIFKILRMKVDYDRALSCCRRRIENGPSRLVFWNHLINGRCQIVSPQRQSLSRPTSVSALQPVVVVYTLAQYKDIIKTFEDLSEADLEGISIFGEIDRDVSRTLRFNELFQNGTRCEFMLKRILRCYARAFPEVGYCQGMNFVVATILLCRIPNHKEFKRMTSVTPNDSASSSTDSLDNECMQIELDIFNLMVYIGSNNSLFNMNNLWMPGVPRIKLRVFQFDKLLQQHLPKLHIHFEVLQLAPEILVSQWFMTLFSYSFRWSTTARLWDYLFFGGFPAVFRVALALLSIVEPVIVSMDLEGVSRLIKDWESALLKCEPQIEGKPPSHLDAIEFVLQKATEMRINKEVLLALEEKFALEMIALSQFCLDHPENVIDWDKDVDTAGSNPKDSNVSGVSTSSGSSSSSSSSSGTQGHGEKSKIKRPSIFKTSLLRAKELFAAHGSHDSISSKSYTLQIDSTNGSNNWFLRYGDNPGVSMQQAQEFVTVRKDLLAMERQNELDKETIIKKLLKEQDDQREYMGRIEKVYSESRPYSEKENRLTEEISHLVASARKTRDKLQELRNIGKEKLRLAKSSSPLSLETTLKSVQQQSPESSNKSPFSDYGGGETRQAFTTKDEVNVDLNNLNFRDSLRDSVDEVAVESMQKEIDDDASSTHSETYGTPDNGSRRESLDASNCDKREDFGLTKVTSISDTSSPPALSSNTSNSSAHGNHNTPKVLERPKLFESSDDDEKSGDIANSKANDDTSNNLDVPLVGNDSEAQLNGDTTIELDSAGNKPEKKSQSLSSWIKAKSKRIQAKIINKINGTHSAPPVTAGADVSNPSHPTDVSQINSPTPLDKHSSTDKQITSTEPTPKRNFFDKLRRKSGPGADSTSNSLPGDEDVHAHNATKVDGVTGGGHGGVSLNFAMEDLSAHRGDRSVLDRDEKAVALLKNDRAPPRTISVAGAPVDVYITEKAKPKRKSGGFFGGLGIDLSTVDDAIQHGIEDITAQLEQVLHPEYQQAQLEKYKEHENTQFDKKWVANSFELESFIANLKYTAITEQIHMGTSDATLLQSPVSLTQSQANSSGSMEKAEKKDKYMTILKYLDDRETDQFIECCRECFLCQLRMSDLDVKLDMVHTIVEKYNKDLSELRELRDEKELAIADYGSQLQKLTDSSIQERQRILLKVTEAYK